MLNKKEIKDIQSLARKKYRDELKLFIAEGPKIVKELIELIPDRVVKVYATNEWIKANPALSHKTQVIEITEIELEKISHLQTPNQVLALIIQGDGVEPDMSSFILYLDAIQDPGNFGTIIRIADWFNIKHIVCSPGCADVYNPKVIQSTMASIARVNVYYHPQDQWLQSKEVPIYAAALHGRSLYDHAKVEHGILIIGNESKGIRPELLELATEKITIPRRGKAESLNAAVATGIILSHIIPPTPKGEG